MQSLSIPALSTAQMQEVDRLMVEQYHIDLLQMMENAGRNLAYLARRMLDGDLLDRSIVVLAGRGNNGGGGLVAARHLLNWGADVQTLCAYAPDAYRGVPARQLQSLHAMGAPLAWAEEGWELPPCDLVIDAIIGYGLRGDPHGRSRDLVQLANSSVAPILSLDAPSGLDTTDGTVFDPCVRATSTLTLALPKQGLLVESARGVCGELFLADIGVPQALYEEMDLPEVPFVFAHDSVVRLQVRDAAAWAADGETG